MQWFGLEIRPQCEFLAKQYLGCEVYLPLVTRQFRISRRCKKKERRSGPMFPGYVFAKLKPTDIWLISRWSFVHGLIERPGHEGAPYPFPETEILRIKTIEAQEYDRSVALVNGWAPTPKQFVAITREHHPMNGMVVQVGGLITKKGKEFWAMLDGKLYRLKTADVVAA